MNNENSVSGEDVMRIMVSTDNHLGYAEKDPIRGEDSFTAFEEMLSLAVTENVDFILLGGDLFHDAVPSQNTLHKCISLLRRYTFGEKAISLEVLSDQTLNFHNAINKSVNYEDPNLNISIPVFSIHGNHDDPSGFGRLSSLDLLATAGLVNYFGRWTDLTKVDINPVLLRKGCTQLALYGLSHIHDGRLQRLFSNHKVEIACPGVETGDWFNLLVVHQNRADRGTKNFLEIKLLPSFMHLIIWGHEHDCQIEPEHYPLQDFYISQPGSSVPTSLSEGESLPKHVGILDVYKTKFQLKPIRLKSVRPFVFESVKLTQMMSELALDEGDASNKVRQMAEERVHDMLERAKQLLTGHNSQPELPLLRLRICFTEEAQMFNAMRFGQMFNEQVANPTDLIHFKKILKKQWKNESNGHQTIDRDAITTTFDKMEIDTCTRVEDLVDRYFEDAKDNKTLQAMPSKILSEMCYRLVERRDTNAADTIIRFYKENAIAHLMQALPEEDVVRAELSNCKLKIKHDDILEMLDKRGVGGNSRTSNSSIGYASLSSTLKSAATNNSAASSSTAGRGRRKCIIDDDDDDDDADMNSNATTSKISTTTTRRGRQRGAKNTTTTTPATTNTRSKRVMPQLDVSINKTTTTRKGTILDAIGNRDQKKNLSVRPKKVATYIVSSDSE